MTMEINYTRQVNTAREAPFIPMEVDGNKFIAKIDTGADLSIIPYDFLNHFVPVGRITIRAYDGSRKRVSAYKGIVTVAGKSIRLKRVLATVGDTGSIGLDVLDHFALLLEGGRVLLEPID